MIARVVTTDGTGVVGARVAVGGAGLDFLGTRLVTGRGGRFLLPDLGEVVALQMQAMGDGVGSEFVQYRLSEGRPPIEIPVSPTLPWSVRIRDASTEAAVSGGTLSLSASGVNLLCIAFPFRDGEVELVGIPDGSYHMTVQAPGYLLWNGAVERGEGRLDIRLEVGEEAAIDGSERDPEVCVAAD